MISPPPDSPVFARQVVMLGSDLAAMMGVGNKGALLDRAAYRRIAVPHGCVLLDRAWRIGVRDGLLVERGGALEAPDPERLVTSLDLPPLVGPVAVRSAFSLEDDVGQSLAGFFESCLSVDPSDPRALATALCRVWSSAERRPGAFRRDVLIMRMVSAQHAGVAFTEREYEDDLVNYVEGLADGLLAGRCAGQSATLGKLREWELSSASDPALPPFAGRLQSLLRDVRAAFGSAEWDIEWADDGARCWLVQIRPITQPPRRNEAFTLANHKEILPSLPSRFMASVIESSAVGLFAYYRRFDKELPSKRPFVEAVKGRPYINLSLMMDMMRSLGLPTRLVTDSIGGDPVRNTSTNPGRLLRKLPVLAGLALAQLRSTRTAHQIAGRILVRTSVEETTFAGNVQVLQRIYIALVRGMFSLTAAMSAPVAALRALGVLEGLAGQIETAGTSVYRDLERLAEVAAENPETLAALGRGELPSDARFRGAWAAFLERHGHRGIYESDVARPRFREDPRPLLRSLPGRRSRSRPAGPTGARARLAGPLWWQASRTLRAREELRSVAMIGFDRIRGRLLRLAQAAVERGQLPTVDALWLLDVEEAARLDDGWTPPADFWPRRRAELGELASYRLPDLVHRFDDVERFRDGSASEQGLAGGALLRGMSLTSGEIRGRAWVLQEPADARPPGFTREGTVLVARSVDAGWVHVFGLVAGVVVDTGGDLSHGSIILREIGIPAVTNTHTATRWLRTGDPLWLRAGAGAVERLEGAAVGDLGLEPGTSRM